MPQLTQGELAELVQLTTRDNGRAIFGVLCDTLALSIGNRPQYWAVLNMHPDSWDDNASQLRMSREMCKASRN